MDFTEHGSADPVEDKFVPGWFEYVLLTKYEWQQDWCRKIFSIANALYSPLLCICMILGGRGEWERGECSI